MTRPFLLLLAGVLAALVLAPTASADDDDPPKKRCQRVLFHCPGHPGGTEDNPLSLPGAPGVLATFRVDDVSEDPCSEVARRHEPLVERWGGVEYRSYAVWADVDGRVRSAWLACGERAEVWGLTSGPGGDGDSLACPGYSRPVDGGAAWTVERRRGYSQGRGGFGTYGDGYWNYRFYNPEFGTVDARLYGICVIG